MPSYLHRNASINYKRRAKRVAWYRELLGHALLEGVKTTKKLYTKMVYSFFVVYKMNELSLLANVDGGSRSHMVIEPFSVFYREADTALRCLSAQDTLIF